jgi:hypothetical protein
MAGARGTRKRVAVRKAVLAVPLVSLVLVALVPYGLYIYKLGRAWDGPPPFREWIWLLGAFVPFWIFSDYVEWLIGKEGIEWGDRYVALVPLIIGDIVLGIAWWVQH